jgi:hypothetical protein
MGRMAPLFFLDNEANVSFIFIRDTGGGGGGAIELYPFHNS